MLQNATRDIKLGGDGCGRRMPMTIVVVELGRLNIIVAAHRAVSEVNWCVMGTIDNRFSTFDVGIVYFI